ncbi:MAG: hypothetical protein ABL903_09070 [Methylococcales bacterium]
MKVINENNTITGNQAINFDAICQEFDGQSFYGLEYVLEDFFQQPTVKSATLRHAYVDWFGLLG